MESKLESHVVTRPMGDALKAAGWTAPTCFVWWYDDPLSSDDPASGFYGDWVLRASEGLFKGDAPAPLATELMEAMDARLYSPGENGEPWLAAITDDTNTAPNPADTLARLWIQVKGKKPEVTP